MNATIAKQFSKLKNFKIKVLIKSQSLNNEQLNSKPDAKSWSLAQVYYHLYLVELRTHHFISSKVKEINALDKTGIKEKWRLWLMNLFLKLPIKFKAPQTVSDDIPNTIDLEKLKGDWENLQMSFKLLLSVQNDQDLEKKIFKHPRIGYLNFYQTLDFLLAHHKHHLKQINGLLSKK